MTDRDMQCQKIVYVNCGWTHSQTLAEPLQDWEKAMYQSVFQMLKHLLGIDLRARVILLYVDTYRGIHPHLRFLALRIASSPSPSLGNDDLFPEVERHWSCRGEVSP